MYFLRGSLPWQGLKAANNKQKYERIGEKKRSVSVADLCDGCPGAYKYRLSMYSNPDSMDVIQSNLLYILITFAS